MTTVCINNHQFPDVYAGLLSGRVAAVSACPVVVCMGQVGLRIKGGHTAGTSRSDGLTVDVIADITGGEDTVDTGCRRAAITAGLYFQVTVIHLQLSVE